MSFTNPRVCRSVLLSFVNYSYERRPYTTILVLTTRKRGVLDRPFHPEYHSQNPDGTDLLLYSVRLTVTYNSKMGRVGKLDQACYRSSKAYNSKKGGVGHRGISMIEIPDDRLQPDNGG
jgi:hypothetical protein